MADVEIRSHSEAQSGFWDTGFGKGLAFAGGVVVGLATGLVIAAVAAFFLPAELLALGGIAIAGIAIGALGVDVIHNWDKYKAQAERLRSGEATAEEWYDTGKTAGGILSIFFGGRASAGGAALRAKAAEELVAGALIPDMATAGAGVRGFSTSGATIATDAAGAITTATTKMLGSAVAAGVTAVMAKLNSRSGGEGEEETGRGSRIDPTKPAQEVLPGSLKRKFPSQYLGMSLNEIKAALQTATGQEKRDLQTAKKLLEQVDRLQQKVGGK